MRIPKYLSPSSLKLSEKKLDEFYLKYLAENRPPRAPQTGPMSVGSAFDAFVKSFLHHRIYGNYGKDDAYDREKIFESQVESANRDFAYEAGEYCFKRYSRCGALSDLLKELDTAIDEPRFEFDLHGTVDGVPLLGKPDIYFTNNQGARVILDWKVNGYCSKSAVSPIKGYVKVRDAWDSTERRASRNNGMPHKGCVLKDHLGIRINIFYHMEDCNADWADQLAIYGWLLGEEVGSENLVIGIDQLACMEKGAHGKPWIRVANHRTTVSHDYQHMLILRIKRLWNAITTGHIFGNLDRKTNDERCADLEQMAKALTATDPLTEFINEECGAW